MARKLRRDRDRGGESDFRDREAPLHGGASIAAAAGPGRAAAGPPAWSVRPQQGLSRAWPSQTLRLAAPSLSALCGFDAAMTPPCTVQGTVQV
jgi:hypothetical protein